MLAPLLVYAVNYFGTSILQQKESLFLLFLLEKETKSPHFKFTLCGKVVYSTQQLLWDSAYTLQTLFLLLWLLEPSFYKLVNALVQSTLFTEYSLADDSQGEQKYSTYYAVIFFLLLWKCSIQDSKKLWPQNCISLQNYIKPMKWSISISHLKNTPSHIEYRELLMSTNQNLPHPWHAPTRISTSNTHQVGMSENCFTLVDLRGSIQ